MVCYPTWEIVCSYSFRSIAFPIWLLLLVDLLVFSFSLPLVLILNFLMPALFLCCDFSSCWLTTTPLGIWVILTALSVVLTDCPLDHLIWKHQFLNLIFNFYINFLSFEEQLLLLLMYVLFVSRCWNLNSMNTWLIF